jgi:Spy/CpxP family protein refolding chaperone
VALLLAFLFVATLLPTLDAAQRRGDMWRHARFGMRMAEKNLYAGKMLLHLKDKIGLTADQVNKIEKMQTAFAEAQLRGKTEIKVQKMKLDTYLKGNKIDRNKMAKMVKSVAALQTSLQLDRLNFLLDVKSVLTAEQIKKLEEFKKNMRHRAFRRYRERRKRPPIQRQ